MANKFYEYYWKDQPKWAKGVISLIVVGGAAWVGYTIYKAGQRKKELKDANRAAESAHNDLARLATQGVKPTLTDTEFQSYAESIVQALQGCYEDENAVFNIINKMKNQADVLRLIEIFGVRYVQPCAASSPISYIRWMFNDKAFGGGLPTILNWGLAASEIKKINAALLAKNINFQF